MPNWLFQFSVTFGPSPNTLPEQFKDAYAGTVTSDFFTEKSIKFNFILDPKTGVLKEIKDLT